MRGEGGQTQGHVGIGLLRRRLRHCGRLLGWRGNLRIWGLILYSQVLSICTKISIYFLFCGVVVNLLSHPPLETY